MGTGIIQDRRGKSFRIEWDMEDDSLNFWLTDERISIGYAHCMIQGKVFLRLEDIIIYDDHNFTHRPKWKLWIDRNLLGKLRGYRNQGLGTSFLQFVISIAKQMGIRRIEGSAHPDRPEDAEALLRWYRRMGFTIKPADKTKLVTSIAELEMVLG